MTAQAIARLNRALARDGKKTKLIKRKNGNVTLSDGQTCTADLIRICRSSPRLQRLIMLIHGSREGSVECTQNSFRRFG